MGKAPFFVALVVCLGAGAASAETIRNEELGFTLTLPEGSREFPEGKQGPDIMYAYAIGPRVDEGQFLAFGVERMRGTIGRENLTLGHYEQYRELQKDNPYAKAIPPDAKVDIITESWQGFEIQVLRMEATFEGVAVITYAAPVPLRREAIQILVGSGQDNAEEGRQLLRTLLANLHGESNWLPNGGILKPQRWSDERLEHLFEGLKDLFTGALIIGIVAYFVRRRKRAKQAQQAAAPTAPVAPPSEEPREE
jgi:hypothetical protein